MTKQLIALLLVAAFVLIPCRATQAAAPSGRYIAHDPPAGYHVEHIGGNTADYSWYGINQWGVEDIVKRIEVVFNHADDRWRTMLSGDMQLPAELAHSTTEYGTTTRELFQVNGHHGILEHNSYDDGEFSEFSMLYGDWVIHVNTSSGPDNAAHVRELQNDALALLATVREVDYFAGAPTGDYVAYDLPAGYEEWKRVGWLDLAGPDGFNSHYARDVTGASANRYTHYISINYQYADDVWKSGLRDFNLSVIEQRTRLADYGTAHTTAEFFTINDLPVLRCSVYDEGRSTGTDYYLLAGEWLVHVTAYGGNLPETQDAYSREAARDAESILQSLRLEPR